MLTGSWKFCITLRAYVLKNASNFCNVFFIMTMGTFIGQNLIINDKNEKGTLVID